MTPAIRYASLAEVAGLLSEFRDEVDDRFANHKLDRQAELRVVDSRVSALVGTCAQEMARRDAAAREVDLRVARLRRDMRWMWIAIVGVVVAVAIVEGGLAIARWW